MVQWCPNLVLMDVNSEIFTPPFVSVLCVDCQYSLRCIFTNQGKFKMNMDSLSCRSQTLQDPHKLHLYLSNASMPSPWSPLLCMLTKNKHRITFLIFTLTIKSQESVREKNPMHRKLLYCKCDTVPSIFWRTSSPRNGWSSWNEIGNAKKGTGKKTKFTQLFLSNQNLNAIFLGRLHISRKSLRGSIMKKLNSHCLNAGNDGHKDDDDCSWEPHLIGLNDHGNDADDCNGNRLE